MKYRAAPERVQRPDDSEEKFPAPEGSGIDATFKAYRRSLELSDAELAEGRTICVIGAGSNGFAAGIERAMPGKHAFVMGVDLMEERYDHLDPAIINHDARKLGFPSDFEGFDTVISFHGIPKYFQFWAEPEWEREDLIADGQEWFDYSLVKEGEGKTLVQVEEAIHDALSEMLRITKPGGKVKMFPVLRQDDLFSAKEDPLLRALETLKTEYPGLGIRRFDWRWDGYGLELEKPAA